MHQLRNDVSVHTKWHLEKSNKKRKSIHHFWINLIFHVGICKSNSFNHLENSFKFISICPKPSHHDTLQILYRKVRNSIRNNFLLPGSASTCITSALDTISIRFLIILKWRVIIHSRDNSQNQLNWYRKISTKFKWNY